MKKKISRRDLIKTAAGWGGSALLGGCGAFRPIRGRKSKRPNILLLNTDDQRWDALGCAGNRVIKTSNMDWLAEKGTRFTNSFVTSPICAASRASLFTGLYERTHGHNFSTPPLNRENIRRSYPSVLREAGYRTGLIGKFGVFVEEGGQNEMFDTFLPFDAGSYFREREGNKKHLTNVIGDEVMGFLEKSSARQPFCLTVGFNAPHADDDNPAQYVWPEETRGLYENIHFRRPPTSEPDFFSSLPPFLQKSLSRERWHWRFDTDEKYQEMIRGYYRMITGVDLTIGRIIRKLRQLDLLDNTVCIFTSDNGYFLGERGFAGKWLLYEPSIRVPLIIFDPRTHFSSPRVFSPMILNLDIAPTLLSLAGLAIPFGYQGKSVLPLLQGRTYERRKEFLLEHLYEHPKIPVSEGLRTENFKYIRYPQFDGKEEMYYHKGDPFEEKNLSGKADYQGELLRMRQLCDKQIAEASRTAPWGV